MDYKETPKNIYISFMYFFVGILLFLFQSFFYKTEWFNYIHNIFYFCFFGILFLFIKLDISYKNNFYDNWFKKMPFNNFKAKISFLVIFIFIFVFSIIPLEYLQIYKKFSNPNTLIFHFFSWSSVLCLFPIFLRILRKEKVK
jgi:hypothetical protein